MEQERKHSVPSPHLGPPELDSKVQSMQGLDEDSTCHSPIDAPV